MRFHRVVVIAAAGLVGAAALASCSSSTPSPSTSPSLPATSAAPSMSPSDVLPPVMVEEGATTATAKVGDAIVFNVKDPTAWTIKSGEPTVVSVTPGGKQGSAMMNPGGTALAAGNAQVTLAPTSGGKAWTVDVTVTE